MREDVGGLLAAEAEEAERHMDEEDLGPSYRRKHPPREPAQVYSVRIPVDKLEQLRERAAEMGIAPSALMRQWVIERLDSLEAVSTDPVLEDLVTVFRLLIQRAEHAEHQVRHGEEGVAWLVATERSRGALPPSLTFSKVFFDEAVADAAAREKGGVVIPIRGARDYRPGHERKRERA